MNFWKHEWRNCEPTFPRDTHEVITMEDLIPTPADRSEDDPWPRSHTMSRFPSSPPMRALLLANRLSASIPSLSLCEPKHSHERKDTLEQSRSAAPAIPPPAISVMRRS